MSYPILAPQNTWWKPNVSTVKSSNITEIELKDSYTPDASVTIADSWDASAAQDGSITCYVIGTKLIIAGNGSGKIAANEDSYRCFSPADKFSSVTRFISIELLEIVGGSISQMFNGCSSLTSIDLLEWDVSNVTDMSGLFAFCSSLHSIDVSTWDVSNVINMATVFAACPSLSSIKGLNTWDVSNVISTSCMFMFSSALTSLDLSNWNLSALEDASFMFKNCSSLASINGLSNLNVSNVSNMQDMFYNCIALTSLDLSSWDVSNVTNNSMMFYNCNNLTSIGDLSQWNTANISSMLGMFTKCTSLTSIGDISNWNVSNVTSMKCMFEDTPKLTGIGNLANWDTSNVTDMSFMFWGASSIKEIDVSKWDVSKVTNFDHFAAHAGLRRKGIENWKTTSAINMNALFHNCAEEELDLSGWDVSKVQFFSQMFENSPNLKHIKGLNKWDTSSGIGFDEMFGRCPKLEELDLSNWNTSKAKNGVKASENGHTTGTFRNFCNDCTNLKQIKLGSNFAVNGDGTNTNAEYKLILPIPAFKNADGLWRTFNGNTYEPNAIPDRTENTYYASEAIIRALPVDINNGTLLDIVAAVREKIPDLAPILLSQLDDAIREI